MKGNPYNCLANNIKPGPVDFVPNGYDNLCSFMHPMAGVLGGSAVIPATVTQTDTDAAAGFVASSRTFTAASIGAVADRDLVIVGVHAHNAGTSLTAVSSMTIGGVSATEIVDVDGGDGGNAEVVALYQAVVPTGTTADIVVTWNAAADSAGICVWTAKNVNITAHASASSTAANPSASIAVEANGVIIGYVGTANARTFTWTNLTEDFDAVDGGGGTHSGASDAFASADASRIITATLSSASSRRAMGLVSYSPA